MYINNKPGNVVDYTPFDVVADFGNLHHALSFKTTSPGAEITGQGVVRFSDSMMPHRVVLSTIEWHLASGHELLGSNASGLSLLGKGVIVKFTPELLQPSQLKEAHVKGSGSASARFSVPLSGTVRNISHRPRARYMTLATPREMSYAFAYADSGLALSLIHRRAIGCVTFTFQYDAAANY